MAKSDVTSEMKVDLQPLQQPQPARASVPDPNMDGPPKVTLSITLILAIDLVMYLIPIQN